IPVDGAPASRLSGGSVPARVVFLWIAHSEGKGGLAPDPVDLVSGWQTLAAGCLSPFSVGQRIVRRSRGKPTANLLRRRGSWPETHSGISRGDRICWPGP